jgi:hypothetical protein
VQDVPTRFVSTKFVFASIRNAGCAQRARRSLVDRFVPESTDTPPPFRSLAIPPGRSRRPRRQL